MAQIPLTLAILNFPLSVIFSFASLYLSREHHQLETKIERFARHSFSRMEDGAG